MAGELVPDRGEITRETGSRVALHDQRPPLASDVTLGGYVGAGWPTRAVSRAELRTLEQRMAEGRPGMP